MPKSATLSSAVDTATKCFATASASSVDRRAAARSPSSSHALHSRALVSVSRVPKVLLDTMNSVVAGSRPASFCAASVGSMLLMKRHSSPSWRYGARAS